MSGPRVSLVVAASANRVIGADGQLPWHLPDDFAWFKRVTMGKPIVMGRRTWESIGRPLPGRRNVVITRQADFVADGADVVGSPDAALELLADTDEIMVIGGGQVYAGMIDLADRIYYTRVDAVIDGDTEFPPLPEDTWRLDSAEPHPADERHAHAFEFRVYSRR